jgi:hypothetical protein
MPSVLNQTFVMDYLFGVYNETLRKDAVGPNRWGPFSESYIATVDKDTRRPNWRQLISNGECATTPLSVNEEHFLATPSDVTVIRDKNTGTEKLRYYLRGQFLNEGKPPPGIPIISVDVENQALSNFYSNLAAVESRFKGLVFAGELKETLRMIRHPARALRNAVSEYLTDVKKRGSKLPRRGRPSFVRDTWLEWSFGVRPLISDLDGAIKAFYASQATHAIFEMVRGYHESEVIVSSQPWWYGPALNSKIEFVRVVLDNTAVKLYGTYKSSGSGISDCHKYGFSPWEFVPTIWNLIPHSYLADYFTNIGAILESWSYRNLGPRFLSRTTFAERRKELRDLRLTPSTPEAGYKITTYGSPGSFASWRRVIQRTPDIGTPLPSLTLKVPGRWNQWVNLAALSKQLDGTRSALRR